MKTIRENYIFIFCIIILDVFIFTAMYVFHALIFKGFDFSFALAKGSYELLWRIICFQLILQFIFMIVALRINKESKLLIFLAAFLAFSISSVLSFSDFYSIYKLMMLPTTKEIGEGFAICCSVTCALLIYKLLAHKSFNK